MPRKELRLDLNNRNTLEPIAGNDPARPANSPLRGESGYPPARALPLCPSLSSSSYWRSRRPLRSKNLSSTDTSSAIIEAFGEESPAGPPSQSPRRRPHGPRAHQSYSGAAPSNTRQEAIVYPRSHLSWAARGRNAAPLEMLVPGQRTHSWYPR